MPKITDEKAKAHEDAIVEACRKLYQTMTFKEITIKEIGSITPFTRTSIYNYFNTKEEIFLALMRKEYEIWAHDIESGVKAGNKLSKQEFAELLAKTLSERVNLLKLLATSLYEIEENSRVSELIKFKKAYGHTLDVIELALKEKVIGMENCNTTEFLHSFVPFVYGLYPYTIGTTKQKEAMKMADASWDCNDRPIYDFALRGIKKLLAA